MQSTEPKSRGVARNEEIELERLTATTNRLIISESMKEGVDVSVVSYEHGLLELSRGGRSAMIRGMRIPLSSGLLSYLADYKNATHAVLSHLGFSVPKSATLKMDCGHGDNIDAEELAALQDAAVQAAETIGFPLVVKPDAEAHGHGVTADVRDMKGVRAAVRFAAFESSRSGHLIVQKFIPGDDFRCLMIDYRVFAVARRDPAFVVGDGEHTIAQLMDEENARRKAFKGPFAPLLPITDDETVSETLERAGITRETVPPAGERVYLRRNANLSSGGVSVDVTEDVCRENLALLERMARTVDTLVTGIDVRCVDLTKPWGPDDYSVIEINTSPGIRMHHFPAPGKGRSRNAAGALLRLLFPELSPMELADGTLIGGDPDAFGVAEAAVAAPIAMMPTDTTAAAEADPSLDTGVSADDVSVTPLPSTAAAGIAGASIAGAGLPGKGPLAARMQSEGRGMGLTHRAPSLRRRLTTGGDSAGGSEDMEGGQRVRTTGIPAVPDRVADALAAYAHARKATLQGWRRDGKGLLLTTRFGEIDQAFCIAAPGGYRKQISFFHDPVHRWQHLPLPEHSDLHLCTMDTMGKESYQLYLVSESTGQTQLLTDGTSRNGKAIFSKDGRHVAFHSTGRTGQAWDVVVAPLDGSGEPRLVTERPGKWIPLSWSPDGKALLVKHFVHITNSALYLVNVETGAMNPVYGPADGERTEAFGTCTFAPDGTGVYATSTMGGTETLTLRYIPLRASPAYALPEGADPVAPGEPMPAPAGDGEPAGILASEVHLTTPGLTRLGDGIDWNVTGMSISGDNSYLAFTANEDGESRLYTMRIPYSADGGMSWLDATRDGGKAFVTKYRAIRLPVRGMIKGIKCRPAVGHEVAFDVECTSTPGDIFTADLETRKVARWTFSEVGPVAASGFSEPTLVRVPSFDDLQIPAFLYLPKDVPMPAGGFPVILYFHGGPAKQFRPGFKANNLCLQHFLNQGIAVLAPNVRGSAGYGRTFVELDNGPLREDSVRDVGALLDFVDSNPDLDEARVAVLGRSYGGYMVLASLIHYGPRIKCGLDTCGITNFGRFLENTAEYRRQLRREEYGDERDPEMRRIMDEISPTARAREIRCPLYLAHGANDSRVPLSEFAALAEAVRPNGQPLWTFVADGEGHVFERASTQELHAQSMVLFVERFLLDKGPRRRRRITSEVIGRR